jgi:hypothetical protein
MLCAAPIFQALGPGASNQAAWPFDDSAVAPPQLLGYHDLRALRAARFPIDLTSGRPGAGFQTQCLFGRRL